MKQTPRHLHQEKRLQSAESEIGKSQSDQRVKKKTTLNNLLQKSTQLINNHNSVFKKQSSGHFGDADTYFRQILRNYDDVDLIRSAGDSSLLKSIEQTDNTLQALQKKQYNNQKRRNKQSNIPDTKLSYQSGDNSTKVKQLFVKFDEKHLFSTAEEDCLNKSDTSIDVNDIYSKQEEKLRLLFHKETVKAQTLQSPAEENIVNKMAEEDFSDMTPMTTDVTETEATVTDVPEESDMEDVERMIKEASKELDQVAEENQQLMTQLEASSKEEPVIDGGSAFKFDPTIDAAVLKELEDAERQAKETAKIIHELKKRVAELCKKEKMNEIEAQELEQKNRELKAQMILFEEKTKRIQFLLGQANLFENYKPPKPSLQQKHNEDQLPKVIVCGLTENNIPKIIVCEDKSRKSSQKSEIAPCGAPSNVCPINGKHQQSVVPQFAAKLNQSYTMQERLAAENANLESTRYKLQSDLFNKDQTLESLQRQVVTLQNEMRVICRENCMLNDKLNKIQVCPQGGDYHQRPSSSQVQPKGDKQQKMPCGKGRGTCPADVQKRLEEYSDTTQQLEQQLISMETDVKEMHTELIAVQKEREHLEHHRKLLCTPCPPCPGIHPCMPPPCYPCPAPCAPPCDQQYRELREQYSRLEDDFKGKVTEVAGLRAENEKLKTIAKDCEDSRKSFDDKIRDLERELKNYKGEKNKYLGSKEQLIELEQQLTVAKQRFREAQDELEELRALIQDQQGQLDDYRNKYLAAQQQVEEQKRQIDLMEMENNRVSEQVNLEIQRVKNQFQEKLQELTPLPDILKQTQIKLQEAQQMHLLAERNNEAMAKELQTYKDKVAAMLNQMEQVRSDQQLGEDQKMGLNARLQRAEERVEELLEMNDQLRNDLQKAEELAESNETKYKEKLHEIAQLNSQLENVREESARQVSRTKDRCETVRRSMQNQISDMERQLAQSRAVARAAQKDRDEIRQKMQAQINNLNENFEDAQMRIKSLQGHVNFLKHSYTTVFQSPGTNATAGDTSEPDPCSCGNDY